MLSTAASEYAHKQWLAVRPGLRELGTQWQSRLDALSGSRKHLLELALGTLPGLDLARVSYDTLISYVDHGLFLREHSPFCRDIPEDIFLHYVFYPRINNEEIVDCRRFFYQQVRDQIRNLSTLDAAMAVNFWCGCQMTYESTDDRTIDPLSAYRCGLGRCGEESTFAVAVLRSAGIPARQIYAPWWSHCDDNHAWVEVYADSQWRFFGACEPEPTPDRGWFTSAASRAMAICSRRFFDYTADGLAAELPLNRLGCCILENQTHRYAKTTRLTVHVPGSRAIVRIFVLNMASLREIAGLSTDEHGNAVFQLGLGSCLIEVSQGNQYCRHCTTLTGPTALTLIPDRDQPETGIWDWDFTAPLAGAGNPPLTPEQVDRRSILLTQAAEARRAKQVPSKTGDSALDARFSRSGENSRNLLAFLSANGTAGRKLLDGLTDKDLRDAPPEILEDFLIHAPELQNIRIGHEPLQPWAKPVQEQIPRDLARNPNALWQWLSAEFPKASCRVYPELWPDPLSVLKLGIGDLRDQSVLFTAALRLAGVSEEANSTAEIPLSFTGGDDMSYGSSWSLSRWDQGWKLLSKEELLHLSQGLYQLITTTRLPNGNQLARIQVFPLTCPTQLPLTKRQASREQMLAHYPIRLPDANQKIHLRLYLDPGTEPTEHALNELLAQNPKELPTAAIHLYIPENTDAQDPTLRKVLAAHPGIQLHRADFRDANLEYLVRALYLEPGVWPLLLLTDGQTGFYSHCGYSVGAIPLALDLLRDLIFD